MNLLTWNIQAAIGTGRYRDYLLRAHRQVMNTPSKTGILLEIARKIAPFDLVCLQEVDLGGRRSGFRSQVDAILAESGHVHAAVQHNRTIPGLSRHGNAILSRWPLANLQDIKLPGRFKGRGCLIADVIGPVRFRVACLHLSLGGEDQDLQLQTIAIALREAGTWAAMGDFNCSARSAPMQAFCKATGGKLPPSPLLTFPSWRPRQDLDHIVASERLDLVHWRAEAARLSDHLALSARLG